jgi:hypothetical protein
MILFFLLDLLPFPRAPTDPLIVSIALRAGTAAGPAVAMDLAGIGGASLIVSIALRAETAAGPAVAMDLAGIGGASEGACSPLANP